MTPIASHRPDDAGDAHAGAPLPVDNSVEQRAYVPAMRDSGAAVEVLGGLAALENVRDVEADVATREITLRWVRPGNWKTIARHLARLGYPAELR